MRSVRILMSTNSIRSKSESGMLMAKRIRPKINQHELFQEVIKKRQDILQSESAPPFATLPRREMGGYGEQKLDILRSYFYSYSAIVSNHFKRFHYLETCAGPGVCTQRGSGRLVLGTPFLAMTNKPAFTRFHFVEIKSALCQALQTRKDLHCPEVDAEIVNDDCNNCAKSIVENLPKNSPVLMVMDPEGLELKWETTVVPLAEHPRSELFINFPFDMGIMRCISPNVSPETEHAVTTYMGTDVWKPIRDDYLQGNISHDNLREAFLRLYTERLQGLGLKEIQVSRLVRSDNNQPLYFLISASRKRVASKIMKDIMKIPVAHQSML